jgi:hypothetical protein
MSKLLLTLASCLMASVLAVTLAAQRGTDFSGSWVLDETQVRPAPDIPQRLVVEQPITTTTARGAPMPPAYLTLNVKRYVGGAVREDSHVIGVTGGVVGGVAGAVSNGASRYGVEWRGDFLWIWRQTTSPSGANIRQRTEAWRIDDLGRLVITIESREAAEPTTTQTLAYLRDKP